MFSGPCSWPCPFARPVVLFLFLATVLECTAKGLEWQERAFGVSLSQVKCFCWLASNRWLFTRSYAFRDPLPKCSAVFLTLSALCRTLRRSRTRTSTKTDILLNGNATKEPRSSYTPSPHAMLRSWSWWLLQCARPRLGYEHHGHECVTFTTSSKPVFASDGELPAASWIE